MDDTRERIFMEMFMRTGDPRYYVARGIERSKNGRTAENTGGSAEKDGLQGQ